MDGSRDFGVRFVDALRRTFCFETGKPARDSERFLHTSLFKTSVRLQKLGSVGMFDPSGGGPNATVGYVGTNPLNYWDVLIAMEGTFVFVGTLTRRWDAKSAGRASFPFAFDPVQAGSGVFSAHDPNRSRGEIWTPLWRKPAGYSELRATFGEGRMTVGGGPARNGLDAARSVAQLGVARGFTGFERYSLIQPASSQPYQATPVGRVWTPRVPRTDLVADLTAGDWLQKARSTANQKTASSRARTTMSALESALFVMTDEGRGIEGTQRALITLGQFGSWLSQIPKEQDKAKGQVKVAPPPPLLSRAWLQRAYDGSADFRIAAALAGIGIPRYVGRTSDSSDSTSQTWAVPPMAAHFAPLTNGSSGVNVHESATFFHEGRLRGLRIWAKNERPPTVVWGRSSLVANMIAVLERRMVEASIRGLADKPLGGAGAARLIDVAAFLDGDFDDARCARLLAGMVWARPWCPALKTDPEHERASLPVAYSALKPIFSTDAALVRTEAITTDASIPIPPGLLAQLRAGGSICDGRRIDRAVRLAFARTRSSGFVSPYDPIRSGGKVGAIPTRIGVGVRPDRLAAAMLIPIFDRGLAGLLRRAYPGTIPDHAIHSSEE